MLSLLPFSQQFITTLTSATTAILTVILHNNFYSYFHFLFLCSFLFLLLILLPIPHLNSSKTCLHVSPSLHQRWREIILFIFACFQFFSKHKRIFIINSFRCEKICDAMTSPLNKAVLRLNQSPISITSSFHKHLRLFIAALLKIRLPFCRSRGYLLFRNPSDQSSSLGDKNGVDATDDQFGVDVIQRRFRRHTRIGFKRHIKANPLVAFQVAIAQVAALLQICFVDILERCPAHCAHVQHFVPRSYNRNDRDFRGALAKQQQQLRHRHTHRTAPLVHDVVHDRLRSHLGNRVFDIRHTREVLVDLHRLVKRNGEKLADHDADERRSDALHQMVQVARELAKHDC